MIKELNKMILYYSREKEIIKMRVEISSMNFSEKRNLYKKISSYNAKIITVEYSVKILTYKFNYSKN
jgi:hypothetical protein